MNLWLCLLVSIVGSFSWDVAVAQRKSCPALTLKNGRVRIRGGGRMAYFRCRKKFRRVGHKLAVCLSSGTWSQQIPVCVGRGCPPLGSLPDMTVKEMYKGGILEFTCAEGMRREGPQTIMCDGTNWDNAPPKCLYGASLGCDFEDSGLCGWSQDTNDHFDWTWTSGFTPTSETGPDADHTTGSGHYIFMESSAPQKFGHVTRLISPPYQPPPEPMCLEFFYHMKGPPKNLEVGDLDVLIRTGTGEDQVDTVLFHRDGYQADHWIQGLVSIPEQQGIFRIVFAATRRQGWSGDIALDDIRVFNCSDMPDNTTTTSTTVATTTTTTTTTVAPTPTPTAAEPINNTSSTTTTTTTTTAPTTSTTTTTTTTTTTPTTTTSTTTPSTSTPTKTTPTPSTTTTTTTTMSTTSTKRMTSTTSKRSSSMMSSTPWTSTDSTPRNVSSSTMTRPTYYPSNTTTTTTTTTTTPAPGSNSTSPGQTRSTSLSPPAISSTSSSSRRTSETFHNVSKSTPVHGDVPRDHQEDVQTTSSVYMDSTPQNNDTSGDGNEVGVQDKAKGGKSSDGGTGTGGVSDYLPLIVGVSLGLAVGMAVVGVLAWLWTRNRRKQKEIQIEEDQLNIIGSIDGASYSYPPSGSEH